MSGRQFQFYQIGLEGCFLDCIVWCAEDFIKQYIDLYDVYLKGNSDKSIGPDPVSHSGTCYVYKPALILSNLTKTWWTMSKEDLLYRCLPSEYEITRYEWQEPSLLHGHFANTDGADMILNDPFGKSATVVNGKPVSKRIFRRT